METIKQIIKETENDIHFIGVITEGFIIPMKQAEEKQDREWIDGLFQVQIDTMEYILKTIKERRKRFSSPKQKHEADICKNSPVGYCVYFTDKDEKGEFFYDNNGIKIYVDLKRKHQSFDYCLFCEESKERK